MRAAPLLPLTGILLILAPTALAGTELAPEVDDSPDQDDPRLDLLGAWFENEPGGVRFTVKVATIEENASDILYYVGFTVMGAQRLAAVEVDADGEILTYLGPPGPGSRGEPPEAIANGALERPRLQRGSPGYATAIVPLEPGTSLENLSAGTSQFQRTRARWADVDRRETDHTFLSQRTFVPSEVGTRWLPIVGGVLVFALGVAVGGWLVARRARRPPKAEPEAFEGSEKRSRFGLSPKR